MLTEDQAVRYLVERGFIRSATIVEERLVVEAAPRRNSNFKIISHGGPCYLLKQGVEAGSVGTVAYEARVYELLAARAGRDGLNDFLPRYYGYDPDQRVLILELHENGQNMREYQVRQNRFPRAAASLIGKVLGSLHSANSADALNGRLSQQPPAILSLHRPTLGLFLDLSASNRQLVKSIQSFPEFAGALERLRQGWHASRLTHGDLRWDNCVFRLDTPKRRPRALRIVDWEFAMLGDPCWDVGSFFAEYLAHWLLAIPSAPDVPPERLVEMSPLRLKQMQPAMRAFWKAYGSCLGLEAAAETAWLRRSVQYTGARLVERTAEQLHRSNQFTAQLIYFLQVAMNIFQRPDDAVEQLLGVV